MRKKFNYMEELGKVAIRSPWPTRATCTQNFWRSSAAAVPACK